MDERKMLLNLLQIRRAGKLNGQQDHLLEECIKDLCEDYEDRTDENLLDATAQYERTMNHG